MTPEQLEEGHQYAYTEFLRYGSILRRSVGLSGATKRIVYNLAWMKVDPLWVAIVRSGLMPFARQFLTRVLWLNSKMTHRSGARTKCKQESVELLARSLEG